MPKTNTSLPIEEVLPALCEALKKRLIEPRRIATPAKAQFLSKSLQKSCGDTVGYRMRLNTKVSANTRIGVITHGVLLRMLQTGPSTHRSSRQRAGIFTKSWRN